MTDTLRLADQLTQYALEAHCARHAAENDADWFMVPQSAEEILGGFSPHLWKNSPSRHGGAWQRMWLLFSGPDVRGHISLTGNVYAPHRAYLGMGIERSWRNKGWGRHMQQTAFLWMATQPALVWVDGQALADNEHVLALDRAMGFWEVGRVPDVLRRPDGRRVAQVILTNKLRND